MNKEIKTISGWCEFTNRTGKGSIYAYLNKGDVVSENLVDYFLDLLPPRSLSHNFMQVGEAYSHVYDIDRRLRATYMTFVRSNGEWRYLGHCFSNETINRD